MGKPGLTKWPGTLKKPQLLPKIIICSYPCLQLRMAVTVFANLPIFANK